MRDIMLRIGRITFVTIEEAFDKKEKFRDMVLSFDVETLQVYKWYFYHQLCYLPHKRNKLKDLMWEYLVGRDVYSELCQEYRNYKLCKNNTK